MKKVKSLIALLLIACLVLALFAACTKTETTTPGNTDNTSKPAEPSKPADTDKPTDTTPPADEDEEAPEINVYLYDLRQTGADYGEHVAEAIRELTLERINVAANANWVTGGNWQNTVLLAISGGEKLDVIATTMGNTPAVLYTQKQALDISKYMEEYGSETLELMKEYIGVGQYGGGLYGIPTLRNYCKNGYIAMNAEILDALGLREKAEKCRSFSELEEIYQAVKENYTDKGEGIYAFGSSSALYSDNYISNGDNFDDYIVYDNLGGTGSTLFCQEDGKIQSYYALPNFADECRRVRDWTEKGYNWPESAVDTTFQDELMKQKVLFSIAVGSEYGVQTTKSNSYGYEVFCLELCKGIVKTAQPLSWGCAVPVTTEEPEAACKFINMMYTDSDLMNLLVWGVEGVDYTVKDDQVVSAEGGHFYEADFLIGNNTILTPLYGNGPDFYEKVKEINATADKSKFLGFNITTTDMDMWLSQISTVTDQYSKSLMYGGYTEEVMAEYVAKLEAAGVRDYQEAAQKQLDAFMAAK